MSETQTPPGFGGFVVTAHRPVARSKSADACIRAATLMLDQASVEITMLGEYLARGRQALLAPQDFRSFPL